MTTSQLAATHQTPAGPFTLITGPDGVHAAGFTAELSAVVALLSPDHRGGEIQLVADTGDPSQAVEAWINGDVEAPVAIPVAVSGTEFQQAIWAALRTIRAGHPLTYSVLATAANRPKAVRAAGTGCATNRASLFIPCHRVIPAGGGVGGFLWGPAVKADLLAHERTLRL